MMDKIDKKKLFKSKLMIALGVCFVALIILILVANRTKKPEAQVQPVKIKTTREVISTDDLWRQTMQEKMKSQEKGLNEELDSLKKDVTETKTTIEKSKYDQKIDRLQGNIEDLYKELVGLKESRSGSGSKETVDAKKDLKAKSINQYVLGLENSRDSKNYKPIKTSDNYIPAGSFAKAVLLSGVDASTSLTSSGDPDPVLIRITDHGTLPRRFKSDLKDCHIIGAAYGDLSSERTKVRLEKLSCTEILTGEIIETAIAGFVAGEDGRQGIRGTVVSTEGKLLGNSFLSGVLGGLANNLNPATAAQGVSLFGSSKKPDTKERLQESFAGGASSSLDRLSKYYIDRAESLQPIVQVGAGRKVDVIFTEGVFFGTSEIKKAISQKRDERIKDTDVKLIQQMS